MKRCDLENLEHAPEFDPLRVKGIVRGKPRRNLSVPRVRKGFTKPDGDLFNSDSRGNVSEKLIVQRFELKPSFFFPIIQHQNTINSFNIEILLRKVAYCDFFDLLSMVRLSWIFFFVIMLKLISFYRVIILYSFYIVMINCDCCFSRLITFLLKRRMYNEYEVCIIIYMDNSVVLYKS